MTGAIVQARMGSTRLPGKVMKKILGRPMLAHLIERLKKSEVIEVIVIATTNRAIDKPILTLAKSYAVEGFTGNEEDVLDRYYQAAKRFRLDPIARITADCPLIDIKITDAAIKYYLSNKNKFDYVTSAKGYPEGLDAEVFSFAALEKSWRQAKKPSEREHVTPYIWNHPEIFRLGNLKWKLKGNFSRLHLSVDEKQDLRFAREVYKRLYRKGKIFYMEDILNLLKKEPGLSKINEGFTGREGYQKSLKQDRLLLKNG